MLHLMLRNELPHAVHVHVEVGTMLVQAHDDILRSSVGKCWDEGRAAPCNNLVDAREETFELFLLIGMRSATVRAFEEEDVHVLGFSTGHERGVTGVKIPCEHHAVCPSIDVEHDGTRNVTCRVKGARPRPVPPRFCPAMGRPRCNRDVDVAFVPSKWVPFDRGHFVTIVPHRFGNGCGKTRTV